MSFEKHTSGELKGMATVNVLLHPNIVEWLEHAEHNHMTDISALCRAAIEQKALEYARENNLL